MESLRKIITVLKSKSSEVTGIVKDAGKSLKSVFRPEIELNKVYIENRTLGKVIPYDVYYQGDIAWVKYHDLNNNGTQEEIELINFMSYFKIAHAL